MMFLCNNYHNLLRNLIFFPRIIYLSEERSKSSAEKDSGNWSKMTPCCKTPYKGKRDLRHNILNAGYFLYLSFPAGKNNFLILS